MYASFIEPYRITLSEFTLNTPLVEPLTIVAFSDTHVRPGKSTQFLQRLVQQINSIQPDIILISGDFIFSPSVGFESLKELQNLTPQIGTYAVLGNHDQGYYKYLSGKTYVKKADITALVQLLDEANITVLRNSTMQIQYGRNSLQISGIDDLWSTTSSIETTVSQLNTNDEFYNILLSHNPSIITNAHSDSYNLIVSGHTHGGQVRLPLIGPVPNLPTTLGPRFDQGIFTVSENTTLAITRGVGESEARTRLLAPPEILVLHVE